MLGDDVVVLECSDSRTISTRMKRRWVRIVALAVTTVAGVAGSALMGAIHLRPAS